VALGIGAGADPKEVAARAGHTSVSSTLDRYEHMLPGSEQRLNVALGTLAERAQPRAEVIDDTEDASSAPEKPISLAHVAHTPDDGDENVIDAQAPDQGETVGAAGLEPTTSAV
jgi:hypothetical protein